MKIDLASLQQSPSLIGWAGKGVGGGTGETEKTAFSQYLQQALGEVNSLQLQSEQASAQLATGEIQDLHQAVLAAEKAMLSLQLTLQIRNKVVDAYQEIMRMQL